MRSWPSRAIAEVPRTRKLAIRPRPAFSEEIYYRVYVERHHVQALQVHGELLFKTMSREIYAPGLFWLTVVPPSLVAEGRTVFSPSPSGRGLGEGIKIIDETV
jgi:hypothetical protein